MFKKLLTLPICRDIDLDDPRTFTLEKQIIRSKPFLQDIYVEWYETISSHLPQGNGLVLELGSGAGFLDEFIPGLVTSDVQYRQEITAVFRGQQLPFADQQLRAIVMCNVLHHIPSVEAFLNEATRCVRPDGRLLMIEPWVTKWSTFVYHWFHHEPFDPNAVEWSFPTQGPLSSANGALPWIVFQRDRERFERDFPEWSILNVEPMMPLRYLLSGGVSRRGIVPFWTKPFFRNLDYGLSRFARIFPMFAFIDLMRI